MPESLKSMTKASTLTNQGGKEQIKPKVNRTKEIINLRAEINEIEFREKLRVETKSQFFEKIDQTDKPVAKLIMRQRKKTQILNIRNKRSDVSTDCTDNERIIR